jgi:hypothetical protein
VVKGTVFSVAIESDATMVSLMEGSVELVADGVAPVLLLPNDTARRGEHDRSINVTKVDVTPPATVPQAAVLGSGSTAPNAMTASAPAMAVDSAIAADLNEITAAHRDPRPAPAVPQNPVPSPPSARAPPSAGEPEPDVPPAPPTAEPPTTPEPPATSVPDVPETQPEAPAPDDDDGHDHDHDHDHDDDDDDDAGSCGRRRCDSDDDHDRGGGNDRR